MPLTSPFELRDPLILIVSILSPAQYLVCTINQEATPYEVFSTSLLPRPS
jgi:hypothetical protein